MAVFINFWPCLFPLNSANQVRSLYCGGRCSGNCCCYGRSGCWSCSCGCSRARWLPNPPDRFGPPPPCPASSCPPSPSCWCSHSRSWDWSLMSMSEGTHCPHPSLGVSAVDRQISSHVVCNWIHLLTPCTGKLSHCVMLQPAKIWNNKHANTWDKYKRTFAYKYWYGHQCYLDIAINEFYGEICFVNHRVDGSDVQRDITQTRFLK